MERDFRNNCKNAIKCPS